MHEKPTPPADNECCESGCCPCVWDLYHEELQLWRVEQEKLKAENASPQDSSSSLPAKEEGTDRP